MNRTAFDDIAQIGELTYGGTTSTPQLVGRVRRRRAVHAAGLGGAAVAVCGVAAAALLTGADGAPPATAPSTALDPASIATLPGTSGGNLVGACQGDGKSVSELMGRDYPQAVASGAYLVTSRHARCDLASVSGGDLISVEVEVSLDSTSPVVARLHSTVTNTSTETLVFDMASPTLTLTVPKPWPQTFETFFSELPVFSKEGLTRPSGVEGWGGVTLGTDGASSQETPVLLGGPKPGDARSLALQRDFENTWYVADSKAKVWLSPGESFEIESQIDALTYGPEPVYGPDIPVTDAHVAALFSGDTSGLEPRFSLSLFNADGTSRTLLVDNAVSLRVAD